MVALINDYIAANEEDIREAVKEDLAELVAELEAGTSTSREFRSSMTDPFVAGTVILALEEAGRSELALATTFMLAELENIAHQRGEGQASRNRRHCGQFLHNDIRDIRLVFRSWWGCC